jgi:hypothetical protein
MPTGATETRCPNGKSASSSHGLEWLREPLGPPRRTRTRGTGALPPEYQDLRVTRELDSRPSTRGTLACRIGDSKSRLS